ncbi:S8 family serine peptidase [Kutzneria kofuensis]|uniref:Subtilase family serine protease n=1 Tax=Kutzneria kofuensis TaxID=103725 RepID=A0A7W9NEG9_9PSEU|nr:S53 family peptidase [Kutzneria kofuensis]MBB5888938.1 subtilase family serine protease [Kutzneria kofuensis]
MTKIPLRILAVVALWAGVTALGGTTTAQAQTITTARSCAEQPAPGFAACKALVRTDSGARTFSPAAPSGLSPANLRAAYKLPTTGGAGLTVAIVDAYDDPNAEKDLATYRSTFGLPACTTANGCFKKVNQSGAASPLPAGNTGWAEEISLDIDMVSAVCPSCHILLVEATSASIANLGTAVNTAVRLGAVAVSNSYGGAEFSTEASADTYYNHPGVAITVSSGDSGYGVEYPAASRYVTAVGGTSLRTASTARGWSETVWSGAGSGCSRYETKPSWQHDTGCTRRTVADVSAVADPATGVAVYDTYGVGGWLVFGGTSVSSPIVAGVYALAGRPAAGSVPASLAYSHTGSLFDVTSGSNGSCSGSYLCTAKASYDGPTGLGTPNGLGAF